jgi:hypothetical protein
MLSDDCHPAEAERITVLVIEPDIIVRMAIADYLRDCGYKVVEGVTNNDVRWRSLTIPMNSSAASTS